MLVKTFRAYLYSLKFIVETDHHSLQWLMKVTAPARLVRWALRLAEYDFAIKYKRGENNTNVDALSRLPIQSGEILSVLIGEDPIKMFNISAYQRQDPDLDGIFEQLDDETRSTSFTFHINRRHSILS